MTKTKIEVFENCMSDKVIATFDTVEAIVLWKAGHNVPAACKSVNGSVLYGWDELYDFV